MEAIDLLRTGHFARDERIGFGGPWQGPLEEAETLLRCQKEGA